MPSDGSDSDLRRVLYGMMGDYYTGSVGLCLFVEREINASDTEHRHRSTTSGSRTEKKGEGEARGGSGGGGDRREQWSGRGRVRDLLASD